VRQQGHAFGGDIEQGGRQPVTAFVEHDPWQEQDAEEDHGTLVSAKEQKAHPMEHFGEPAIDEHQGREQANKPQNGGDAHRQISPQVAKALSATAWRLVKVSGIEIRLASLAGRRLPDDRHELGGDETGAAHESAVDLGLAHEFRDVVGAHASAVLNAH